MSWLKVLVPLFGLISAEADTSETPFLCHKSCHCRDEKNAICEDSSLSKLENVQFEPVLESITLINNSFVELQPGLFNLMTDLVQVEVQWNPISAIRPITFQSLPRLESVKIENNQKLKFVDRSAFLNLTSLEMVSLKNNPDLFYIDPLAFIETNILKMLDISGSAIFALDSRKFPNNINIVSRSNQINCQNCLNLNNRECEGDKKSHSLFEECDGELAYPVVENFEFTFEIYTVNTARCFFLGGVNNPESEFVLPEFIIAGDIIISEAGVWEPNPVTRKLEGEYRCSKGDKSHAISINVFPSEDKIYDSWDDLSSNETVEEELTLGIADFDLSADVFSDPEIYYQNRTKETEEENEGSAQPSTQEGSGSNPDTTEDTIINTGNVGWKFWNWISLTIVLCIAILLVLLCIIMPRCGLYTVLFNLQHVPPKQNVDC